MRASALISNCFRGRACQLIGILEIQFATAIEIEQSGLVQQFITSLNQIAFRFQVVILSPYRATSSHCPTVTAGCHGQPVPSGYCCEWHSG